MVSRRSLLLATPLAATALAVDHPWLATGRSTRPGRAGAAANLPGSAVASAELAEPDQAAVDAGAAAVRAFSADLYRDLAAGIGRLENVVCSPYSAAVALAMARAGARGQTAAEMDTVLHAPQPAPAALDRGLNALDQVLAAEYDDPSGDGFKRPRISTANSLWTQYDLPLEVAFRETLARFYSADAHRVDFLRATEAARVEINSWVSDRTSGKIPELLARTDLGPMTKLVLTNALYLKASWLSPFPLPATQPAGFTRDDGRTVTVPMMTSSIQPLGYAEGDGWFAVDLPYVGSQLAMAIIVPTRGSLAGLEAAFDGRWLTNLLGAFRSEMVQLRLPRWTFRLPIELRGLLAGLGMRTAFSDTADFSGITSAMRLCIDKVVHETFIAVDEKGTEAAAATAVIIRPPSIIESRRVSVDRSFGYVIHDIDRAVPLFLGRVADPSISA